MRLAKTRLKRGRLIPGLGSQREAADLGPAEVIGPWVVVTTPEGPVALWGEDVAPSEVDADSIRPSAEAPARGRARPAGTEGQ